jgi:molybdate transport system permease protein
MTSKLWLSLQVAGVATVGGLAPGIWLAYRLAMRESVGRKLLLGALALLFAAPLVILAWVLLRPAFPWQVGAVAGALAVIPVVVLGSRHRVAEVNRAYGNAARSLGCTEWRIFWRVVLPLAWPALIAAAGVAFVRVWAEWAIVAAL